jgi:hypothetical protein
MKTSSYDVFLLSILDIGGTGIALLPAATSEAKGATHDIQGTG